MTPSQKRLRELRERQSRERQRMAELALEDSLTDETRAELDKLEQGTPDLERLIRAARTSMDAEQEGETREDDGEDREMRALRGRVQVGNYITAALETRAVGGAEAEYNAALEMSLGAFPLEFLTPVETPHHDGHRKQRQPGDLA